MEVSAVVVNQKKMDSSLRPVAAALEEAAAAPPPPAAAAELLTATARRNALFRASQQGKLGLLGILKKCACFSSTTQVVSSKRPPSITTEEGESPTAL